MDCNNDCINFPHKCAYCKYNMKDTMCDFYITAKVSDMPVVEPSKSKRHRRSNYTNGIRAERVVANKFGGSLVPSSGALASVAIGLAGDVVFPDSNVLAQVKTRVKRGEDQDTIVIQKEWLDKHWKQANATGRIPVLIFSFFSNERFWAISEYDPPMGMTLFWRCTGKKTIKISKDMLSDLPLLFTFKDFDKMYQIQTCEQFFEELNNGTD